MADAQNIRTNCFEVVRKAIAPYDVLNTLTDIVDDCVILRRNGLVIPGGFKPTYKDRKSKGGRYNIVAHGQPCDGGEHNLVYYDTLEEWLEAIPLSFLIDHAFSVVRTVKQKKAKSKPKPKTSQNKPVTSKPAIGKYKIDLPMFLKAMRGYIPSETEYKSICMFLANTDISSTEAGRLCNEEWNPPDNQLQETERFINNYRGSSLVGPRKLIELLEKHKVSKVDIEKIFPRKRYKYYNEYRLFLGKPHELCEIKQFVRDVISWVTHERCFCWKFVTKKRDGYGNQFEEIHTNLTKTAPWKKNMDDVKLQIYPTRATIHQIIDKKMTKMMKKECDDNDSTVELRKLRMASKGLSDLEYYEMCKDALQLQLDYVRLGAVVLEMQEEHMLKRWQNVIFKPFFGLTSTCHPETLNVFTPFPLLTYKPKSESIFQSKKIH